MKTATSILVVSVLLALTASAQQARLVCPPGQILAGGAVDETVFLRTASRGVRAEWCERYDALGRSERIGPYRERDRDGALRLEATYVGGRLAGPVVAYHEDGSVFLRGRLVAGRWDGAVSLHRENGEALWSGTYSEGRLVAREDTDASLVSPVAHAPAPRDTPARPRASQRATGRASQRTSADGATMTPTTTTAAGIRAAR